MRSGLGTIIWLVVGGVIASSHHYLAHFSTIKAIGSVILAVALWPLLLIGINLHIR